MNEHDLDAELAAANPIDERTLASAVPPGVGEAMLREITSAGRAMLWQRIATPAAGGLGSARAGFVGVMAVVALAVVALSVASIGGGQRDADAAGDAVQDAEIPRSSANLDDDPVTPVPSTPPPTPSTSAPTDDTVTTTVPSTSTSSAPQSSSAQNPTGVEPNPTPAPGSTPVGAACVTIEGEALQINGAWNRRSDGAASGGQYIVWEGLSAERNNESPADTITATFNIANPGSYRFIWSTRQPSDVVGDSANDSWLNFPDAARFGPVQGGSYEGFVNVFGTGEGNFVWDAKADHQEVTSDIAIEFPQPGQYSMQLAGRSHGHQIDKIVIYHDAIARDDAIANRCTISKPARP